MKNMAKGLSCDVELGGIKDIATITKYATIIGIGVFGLYAIKKFNIFGGLKWLGKTTKDLVQAPKIIAKLVDTEIDEVIFQVEKMFDMLKQRTDNFNRDYGSLYSQWQPLKAKAIANVGSKVYGQTLRYYASSKTSKEKIMAEMNTFRAKVLAELRKFQKKDAIGCLPCLFF